MSINRIRRVRLASGLAALGVVLVPLSGCSGDTASDISGALESGTSESSSAVGEDTATSAADPTSGTSPGTDVDCTGTSCELTLTGAGTEVEVLGATVSLGQVQDGRATISVGDRELSCAQGESVSAGPLTLECRTVSDQTVTLTASLG
jgi:ferric-dicitrate binding protein FerR (iron transport regulator)